MGHRRTITSMQTRASDFRVHHCLYLFCLLIVGAYSLTHVDERESSENNTNASAKKGRDVCQSPLAVGNGSRQFTRFYFDKATERCYKFTYRGNTGNGNRFLSKRQCKQRCVPGWRKKKAKVVAVLKDPTQSWDYSCAGCEQRNGECYNGKCRCRKGFEMQKFNCVDINECHWVKCPPSSFCVNTAGSFYCQCESGFAGSGFNCTKDRSICSQPFDRRYEKRCQPEVGELRYFYDATLDSCHRFWYRGCQFSDSSNFFGDLRTCQSTCHGYGNETTLSNDINALSSPTTTTARCTFALAEACLDEFDELRRRPCGNGPWAHRYFFDANEQRCIMYWADISCEPNNSMSRNVFAHLSTCKRACEVSLVPDYAAYDNVTLSVSPPPTLVAISIDPAREFERLKPAEKATTLAEVSRTTEGPSAEAILIKEAEPSALSPTSASAEITTEETLRRAEYEVLRSREQDGEAKNNYILAFKPLEDPNSIWSTMSSLEEPTTHSDAKRQTPFSVRMLRKYTTLAAECLEPFDKNLTRPCSHGRNPWRPRYYYDHSERRCRMYWNDGCRASSRNDFADQGSCKWRCEGELPPSETGSCLDTFDRAYTDDCNDGRYEVRYYFNHERKQCQLFYYGGCKSTSRNIFRAYRECQSFCERPTPKTSQVCQQPFDAVYRHSCNNDGQWAQYYYYDHWSRSCRMFWYGNCKSSSENIFATLLSCQWLCEREQQQKVPKHCLDPFDEGYRRQCSRGAWVQKYYFEHATGECKQFWYDGCTSDSQNIFPDKTTCQNLCELPTYQVEQSGGYLDVQRDEKDSLRCLEPVKVGDCKHQLPAYYYNKHTRRCEPFAYSGCSGNGNRFLTLSHCENICGRFKQLKADETNCFLPLKVGYGRANDTCNRRAGYRFYYNHQYEKCGRFWFFGCGENANSFGSYHDCERTCRRSKSIALKADAPPPVAACFRETDPGSCPGGGLAVKRWTYSTSIKQCVPFEYAGCGGNENRFDSERDCKGLCDGLVAPKTLKCAHFPDWGPCNRLRYEWFYNMTSGRCEQFLWGGCGGNSNRFGSFELCELTCRQDGKGTIPPTHHPMYRHEVLSMKRRRYVKTDGQYIDYGHCVGFRYNVSGAHTRLNSYLCLMEEGGTCRVQTMRDTRGEELCRVVRPWIRGSHYYSWFFTLDQRAWRKSKDHPTRPASADEAIATLIILPLNDCHSIC